MKARTTRKMDMDKRLGLSVPEAGLLLGLARSASYSAAKRGEIPTIKIGGKFIVPKAALERMLAEAGQGTATNIQSANS